MYFKLALRNVKRQFSNYIIYFITVAFTVALLFAVNSIIFSDNMNAIVQENSQFLAGLLSIVIFISLIVSFVLSYATSFMLKLRKREFGTYLTLGMSRKNILTIFIVETLAICLIALIIGLVIGIFIYQGLTALMMNLLDMKITLSSYSLKGLIITICLVFGIFLFASITSAIYLKRVSIYDLINGDKKVDKKVKYPVLWLIISIISFIIIIISIILFDIGLKNSIIKNQGSNLILISLITFAISIILFHIGLSRSLVNVLLKKSTFKIKGTNTFTLRQLSGSLGKNSVLLGILAFLLTFTLIGSNFSFLQKAASEESLNKNYPYDILYHKDLLSDNEYDSVSPETAEQIIKEYINIENKLNFNFYTSEKNDFINFTDRKEQNDTDVFISESDFNKLITPLGYKSISLENEYLIVSNYTKINKLNWKDFVFEWNDSLYKNRPDNTVYPQFGYIYFYAVVPDDAISDMTKKYDYVAYDLAEGKYDAVALKEKLSYKIPNGDGFYYERCDFLLKEYSRISGNSFNAIIIIGALFIAAVFMLMVMAILALKTLSSISDDKKGYDILSRLGADRSVLVKTLFKQTFSFFILPFILSILMSIPVGIIGAHLYSLVNMTALIGTIPIISLAVAGIMILVYLLYFTATFMIAKKSVIQSA